MDKIGFQGINFGLWLSRHFQLIVLFHIRRHGHTCIYVYELICLVYLIFSPGNQDIYIKTSFYVIMLDWMILCMFFKKIFFSTLGWGSHLRIYNFSYLYSSPCSLDLRKFQESMIWSMSERMSVSCCLAFSLHSSFSLCSPSFSCSCTSSYVASTVWKSMHVYLQFYSFINLLSTVMCIYNVTGNKYSDMFIVTATSNLHT